MKTIEMTMTQRISFLDRAIGELNLELSRIETGLGGDASTAPPRVDTISTLTEQHADLARMLREQRASLKKILHEALEDMEKLERGPTAQ